MEITDLTTVFTAWTRIAVDAPSWVQEAALAVLVVGDFKLCLRPLLCCAIHVYNKLFSC